MFDPHRFVSDRAKAVDASGIRRVFDLAAKLDNPINLSIGQPDFDVPDPVKEAAIEAIRAGRNRYTVTQGTAELRERIKTHIAEQLPHWSPDAFGTLVTSGVSGGLLLTLLATVGPGDEVIIPDPYFVMYRHLVTLAGATPVYVDTQPDFQVTADRIAGHVTERTKLIMFNSPSNPTGIVASIDACRDVVALAQKHNLLIVSDEIYDEFCYEKVDAQVTHDNTTHHYHGCPTPAWFSDNVLVLRGFSKTYAMTGWRLGYAIGPKPIVDQMTKLQQYTFVCAPSMVQSAGVVALDVDMNDYVNAYRAKRDRVVERLSKTFNLTTPGGAFYAFPQVPDRLNMTGTQFVEQAIARGVLVIPGSVFSNHDTHLRLSYACDNDTLERGLDVLCELAK